jgi:hypothetical protein
MLIDCFNKCVCARSLDIVAQIKTMKTFVGTFMSMVWYLFRLLSEKYKIVSWKKEEFEDLDDCSFLLDFIL